MIPILPQLRYSEQRYRCQSGHRKSVSRVEVSNLMIQREKRHLHIWHYDAKITITVELNDTLLLQKIEQGEVVFAHHIECPQTCYRRVIKTKEKVKDILLKDN